MNREELIKFQEEETNRIMEKGICILCFKKVNIEKMSKQEEEDYFEFLLCPKCVKVGETIKKSNERR